MVKPFLKNYSPVILILKRNWKNIFGEKYFEFCEPEKVYFQKDKKNDGVLYIIAFNAVISFYIDNNKEFILEKINSIFGYKLIKDLRIKQNPKIISQYLKNVIKLDKNQKNEIENKINKIEDTDLKKSLEYLGEILYYSKDKK